MTVTSCNTSQPNCFAKIVEKNVAKENLRDQFGRKIYPRECYLKGFYLQKNKSKNINIKRFFILKYDMYLTPGEIF